MGEYRVWYRPYSYAMDNDEEDYIEVEAKNEQEARRHGSAFGWVTDVEPLK